MTRCPECGHDDPKETNDRVRTTKDALAKVSMKLIGLVAIVASVATATSMWSSRSQCRFEMKGVGEHLYLIDQNTGIVRVFRGEREVHRFDAPVPLDEYTGDWLVGMSSPDADEAMVDDDEENW